MKIIKNGENETHNLKAISRDFAENRREEQINRIMDEKNEEVGNLQEV